MSTERDEPESERRARERRAKKDRRGLLRWDPKRKDRRRLAERRRGRPES
jgi:hypothetical protein